MDAVKDELEKLCGQDAIETAKAKEWLASIVVARNADNKIRLCADLRALNREVILNKQISLAHHFRNFHSTC